MTGSPPLFRHPARTAIALAGLALIVGCSTSFRLMRHSDGTDFPGASGDPARYESDRTAWSRTEALGIRSSATVTLIDPALGAELLAHDASASHREVTPENDLATWQGLYGERGDRLPFDVSWRFDKQFQPQRVTDPHQGWTFTLHDDHGRSWAPVTVDEVTQGSDDDAWTGRFRVWFPARDVLKGPLFDGRTGTVTLRITGDPGSADFFWKFRPNTGAQAED